MPEQIDAKEVAKINAMFDERDLDEIINDAEARKEIIAYLRKVRLNVREAEGKGKRPTKKAARGDVEEKISTMTTDDILNLPVSELKGKK
jgi:hypothetical protein